MSTRLVIVFGRITLPSSPLHPRVSMNHRVATITFLSLFVPAYAHADEPRAPLAPFAIAPAAILAPKAPNPPPLAARDAYLAYETQAMSTLMSWAVASVATGAMLWSTSSDDYTRAIGIQNVAWGAIDGVIAGFGYRGIRKQSFLDKPVSYWQAEDRKLRKVFLINAGLDVLYVAAGAALLSFGKNDLVRGSGAGVILQGSFLFVFDGAMGIGLK